MEEMRRIIYDERKLKDVGLIPLDLVQALLPLCVFDPVADDSAVLTDVVLKALQDNQTPSSLFELLNLLVSNLQGCQCAELELRPFSS